MTMSSAISEAGSTGSAPVQQQPQAIILPGFGREEQLEIDCTSLVFRSTWTSKTYTDAAWASRLGLSSSRLRALHYGNNMTLLCKACTHLRRYYASSSFWSAVACGFSCKAHCAMTQLDTLVRARRAHLRQYGNGFKSAATAAIDIWIHVTTTKQSIGGNASAPVPNDKLLFETAERYYRDAKSPRFLHRDAAGVLSTMPEPSVSHSLRKRSRSPSDSCDEEPFSAGSKRRTRPSDGRPVESPSKGRSPWKGLAPLETEFREPDYARKPLSASHLHSHDTNPGEPLGRIRGFSNHDSLPLKPPATASEGFPPHSSRENSLENVNELLRDRNDMLERKLEMQQKTAAEAAQHAAATHRQTMDILTILEDKLAETEAQRVKDSEQARARMATLEAKLTAQQTQIVASQVLLTKIGFPAEELAGKEQPSQGIWDTIKRFEDRLARLDDKTTANSLDEEYLQGLGSRIASLEGQTEEFLQRAAVDRRRIDSSQEALDELRQRLAELTTIVARLNDTRQENQEFKTRFEEMTSMVNDIKSSRVSHENMNSLHDKIVMLDSRVDKIDRGLAQASDIKILQRQIQENMARNTVLEEQIKSLHEGQEDTAQRITELVHLLHNSLAS